MTSGSDLSPFLKIADSIWSIAKSSARIFWLYWMYRQNYRNILH